MSGTHWIMQRSKDLGQDANKLDNFKNDQTIHYLVYWIIEPISNGHSK
jgi:hypothetical protein